ncbi:response regulator [Leptolyngbya sp. GB1-A1]|uniref:hybrid sensor histidine kinase/response regulator n=1 Tax=Leptolyngbya sp. GB1-A1 TaxID=2933908 RepID=UPI0032995FFF
MLPEQQQRIMGYFIEEAKDHLNTIEQGLINLQATIEDSEMVHEVFRAAHSVKGGAAMLGLAGIQHAAHRLEDYFKVLKECPGVKTTQKLETLFLRVFDTLAALIEQLQGPFGLTEDKSAELMAAVEPVFAELSQSLSLIVSQTGATLPEDVELDAPVSLAAPEPLPIPQPAVHSELSSALAAQEESAIQLIFQSDVPALLRQMLQLFKQPDSPQTREQLQGICEALGQPGEQLDLPDWCDLIQEVKRSIACLENTYRVLAPVVIKEVKQAQELVLAGRSIEISPSQNLLDLLPPETKWDSEEELEADFSAWFDSDEEVAVLTDTVLSELDVEVPVSLAGAGVAGQDDAADFQANREDLLNELFSSNSVSDAAVHSAQEQADFSLFEVDQPDGVLGRSGPEVGAAELTSLADLFDADFSAPLPNEVDWTDAFDESFDSPLSEMDTVLELGDEANGLTDSYQSRAQNKFEPDELELDELEPEENEALTLDEGDDDLSALLEAAEPFNLTNSTENFTETALPSLETELFANLEQETETGSVISGFAELESLSEDSLDRGFEAQPTPLQTDTEEAFLTSVFSDFDRVGESAGTLLDAFSLDAFSPLSDGAENQAAEPEFFELFGLESSDDSIEPALELPDEENDGDRMTADFDNLFGQEELLEVPDEGDSEPSFAENFAFDRTEPNAVDRAAPDGFADLFWENTPPSIQPEELLQSEDPPFDAEVSTDLWLDPDDSSGLAELNLAGLDLAELIENEELEGEELENEELEGEDLAALVAGDLTSSEVFSEGSAELPEMFSLEQEDSEFDLSPTEIERLVETLDEQPDEQPQFHQEIDSASLPNLFDSTLVEADGNAIEENIEENFDDLEALLAAEEMPPSDWAWAEAAIEVEPLAVDGNESNPGDVLSDISDLSVSDRLVEDEFADLEALLDQDLDDSPMAAPMTAPISRLEDSGAQNADEFADLEALLEDKSFTAPPEVDVPISNLPIARLPAEDEFGDLEALIENVDQVLGVGSSLVRKTASTANRRPNRRNVLKEQTMRVSVKHLDNLNNLVGEMVVNRNGLEQAQERLRQFLDNLLYQVQQLSDVGQRMRDLYERSLLERSLLSSRRGYSATGTGSAPSQTSHAIGVNFDALEIDQFSPFHTLSQEMIELIVRVREASSDIDFVVEESDQVTRNFRQITTQLQEGLTRSRMVPFAQTVDRLPRGVRDNSLKYGKQAELVIEGRETLIDKMIVEQLSDPMTHLVNNAIAHGIETPEERIAAGKSPTGRIMVRAFHQGNQTIISVSDDGAGINPEGVKAKALERGLITPAEARDLSRLEIYDLLFQHGFSTVDQADDLRGRGVGLDVVRNNLSEIRGSITIDSAIGKGTTFTIRLPLTLSISKALCCISNRARIAFPMDGIEDMFDVPKDRLQTDDQGASYVPWRDMVLPLQPLSDLLRYNRILGRGSVYGGNQEDDMVSIVVLRSAGTLLALQVDQVLGEQEIVIKQLEGPVPKPIGVAGATVLGDGRIMPIADVLELIDLWQGRIRREAGTTLWERERGPIVEESTKAEPTVLIVDDSITVRELLSMTFNKVGYRVEQARDGQEAWEKLRAGLPCSLVFCDIEMPRMDGLELLSRLQKDPHLCELPIAMLTSRGADRHKQMAIQLGAKGYFTKPYLEEVLLDAAQRMLRGEVLVNGNSTSTAT